MAELAKTWIFCPSNVKWVALFCATLKVRGTEGDEGIEETLEAGVEETANVGDGRDCGERIDSLLEVKLGWFWETEPIRSGREKKNINVHILSK